MVKTGDLRPCPGIGMTTNPSRGCRRTSRGSRTAKARRWRRPRVLSFPPPAPPSRPSFRPIRSHEMPATGSRFRGDLAHTGHDVVLSLLDAGLHVAQLGGVEPGARADRLLLADDPRDDRTARSRRRSSRARRRRRVPSCTDAAYPRGHSLFPPPPTPRTASPPRHEMENVPNLPSRRRATRIRRGGRPALHQR